MFDSLRYILPFLIIQSIWTADMASDIFAAGMTVQDLPILTMIQNRDKKNADLADVVCDNFFYSCTNCWVLRAFFYLFFCILCVNFSIFACFYISFFCTQVVC